LAFGFALEVNASRLDNMEVWWSALHYTRGLDLDAQQAHALHFTQLVVMYMDTKNNDHSNFRKLSLRFFRNNRFRM